MNDVRIVARDGGFEVITSFGVPQIGSQPNGRGKFFKTRKEAEAFACEAFKKGAWAEVDDGSEPIT